MLRSSSLVALDVLALGDVPLGRALVEPPLAVRALDVVGRVGGRGRGEVGDFAAGRQVALGLLGGAQGVDEVGALLAPVGFLGGLKIKEVQDCVWF